MDYQSIASYLRKITLKETALLLRLISMRVNFISYRATQASFKEEAERIIEENPDACEAVKQLAGFENEPETLFWIVIKEMEVEGGHNI